MKTQLKNLIQYFSIAFLIAVIPSASFAQKRSSSIIPGINVNHYVTGNGHGSMYNPEIQFKYNSTGVAFGPTIQKYSSALNGARFTLTYSVAGNPYYGINQNGRKSLRYECDMELYFFISAHYLRGATITPKTLRIENSEDRNNHIQYNTGELFAGMGFNRYFFDRFSARFFIGLGHYVHFNYSTPYFHPSNGTMLMTGVGIGILK